MLGNCSNLNTKKAKAFSKTATREKEWTQLDHVTISEQEIL